MTKTYPHTDCSDDHERTGPGLRRRRLRTAVKLGLPDEYCETIRFCAQLHDVGKMSVNTAILTKAGALDEDERVEMDRHTSYGHQILAQNDRLQMAADIAIGHHEKWDGSGYPNQLQGNDIPIEGRIVALADVFDALTSRRPYKEAWSVEKTMTYIQEQKGKHFDPELVNLFEQQLPAILAIKERWQDD